MATRLPLMTETVDAMSTRESTPPIVSDTLQGERLAFTGTLASMTHRQAQQLAEAHSGTATPHISRQTTILVVGEEGWPLEADGTPSVKLQHVQRLCEEGLAIRVLSESDWLTCLGLHDKLQDVRRHYTPAMLSQLLNVPVTTIRLWERSGLIHPVRHVMRLPYFDFREVAGARKLAELLQSGVSRKQIAESLEHLKTWVGGTERPLTQLEILTGPRQLIYRDETGLIDPFSKQRLFDFEEPVANTTGASPPTIAYLPEEPETAHWHGDDWLQAAQQYVDDNRLDDAVEAYRLALLDLPQRAEIHFQLADTLFRLENLPGALERYHMAVELDAHYLEAWTQLGCVYAELQQLDAAVHALQIALDLHPAYPEAHWHIAQIYQRQGQFDRARPHWEQYLQHDQRGPWAEVARQNLGL